MLAEEKVEWLQNFAIEASKYVLQKRSTNMFCKNVQQLSLTKMFNKNVPQICSTKMFCKNVHQ
jgi:hypothetical protein